MTDAVEIKQGGIGMVHQENLKLIKELGIHEGSTFVLKDKNKKLPKVAVVTSIHPLYGWVCFNGVDTNIPQRVSSFLKLYSK